MSLAPRDRRPGRARSGRPSGYRSRSYYLPDDLHYRLRNAWWHAGKEHDSLSALVAAALRPVVEDLEDRFNEGRPFPELPDGMRLAPGPRRGGRTAEPRPRRAPHASGPGGQGDDVNVPIEVRHGPREKP